MQHRLIASYAVLVCLALGLFAIPDTVNLSRLLHRNQEEVALREAHTIAFLLGAVVDSAQVDATEEQVTARALSELRQAFEAETGGRVELINVARQPALGRPVVRPDSPEMLAALRGEESVVTVDRSVLGEAGVEVTIPARNEAGEISGAVRLTFPQRPVDEQVRSVWAFRLSVGLLVLAAASAVAFLLARSLTRPLRELTAMAAKLSSGDFDARVQERDPREIRQLGRTLNEGARQLGALVTAQQRFIADASHQLRTPLTALRLNLDTLQEVQREPATRRVLDRTITEVVRMTRLVNDLLALARSQAQTVHLEPANLAEVVHERVQAWEAAADEHDVTLDARPHPDHTVLFTPGQIEQVLDNVLSNALAVAPAGSTVRIRSRADGGRVHLEIADQGPGMSEQQIEHAFDRFWRGRTGGTGLGLTIVREFVELNDGNVQLRNAQPSGLVVDLALKAGSR